MSEIGKSLSIQMMLHCQSEHPHGSSAGAAGRAAAVQPRLCAPVHQHERGGCAGPVQQLSQLVNKGQGHEDLLQCPREGRSSGAVVVTQQGADGNKALHFPNTTAKEQRPGMQLQLCAAYSPGMPSRGACPLSA